MNESERKELEEAFIELPLVAVHTDNPISQVELRTNGDRVANVNGGTPQCNQVWAKFVVRAVNSHYKLLEMLRFLCDAADTEPGMAIYKAHIQSARAAIADASK